MESELKSVKGWKEFRSSHPYVGKRTCEQEIKEFKLRNYLVDGIRILELGYGLGGFVESLLHTGISFEYYGLDINEYLCNEVKKRYKTRENVHILKRDLTRKESYSDIEEIDFVVAFSVLHHIEPSFEKILQILYPLLRENGKVIFTTPEGKSKISYSKEGLFIRSYTQNEIEEIAKVTKFKLIDKFFILFSVGKRSCWILQKIEKKEK